MQPSFFIAVDWGTSRLRAYLCRIDKDHQLHLIASSSGLGVSKVTDSFSATLQTCIQPWEQEYGKLPVLMSGQIGSSIGWHETDYLACPVSPDKLASRCLVFENEGYEITIIPGLSCLLDNQNHDVMRGEELQVLGWLKQDQKHQQGSHLICLPGTHTKWVFVQDGEIVLFKTAMTGELYDLLVNHSVIIQDKSTDFDAEAFELGARFTLQSEAGSLVHGLFSVRSKQLFGRLTPQDSTSYLSGLLIGSDVRAAINASEWDFKALDKIAIIGSPDLSRSFAHVLEIQGYKTEICQHTKTTLTGFNSVFTSLQDAKKIDS